MLWIVDTEGSKLANLHYLLLLYQATVTFSAPERERHLSPQLCWLENVRPGPVRSGLKINDQPACQPAVASKQSPFSVSLCGHKLRRVECFWKSLLFMPGFYMRKTNTPEYRNVCDIPVFTEASSHWLLLPLLVFLFNLCLVSFSQRYVDFSQDGKRWSVLTAASDPIKQLI